MAGQSFPPIENEQLGEVLLQAGELLYCPHLIHTDPMDSKVGLAAEFLPVTEVDSLNDPIFLFLRTYIILNNVIPGMGEAGKRFDIATMFAKHYGISMELYGECLFAFLSHALSERNKTHFPVEDVGLKTEFFRTTDIPADVFQTVFSDIAFSANDLPLKIESRGYADFDRLRDRPYFRFGEANYCLDYEFAFCKFESAVIWRLLRTMDKSQGDLYLSFWGEIFESYLHWLFEVYVPTRLGKFHWSPRFADGSNEEICDALVVCGDTAVLIEAKLATCPSAVKYSCDHGRLRNFLDERLVFGKERKVGVSQLARSLTRLSNSPKEHWPDSLLRVKKWIPLIITRDDIGSSWMINAYLDAQFDGLFRRKDFRSITVTPLVSMSVGTLERAMRALKKISFSDFLQERIRKDRKLQMPFEAASSYVPRGMPRGLDRHIVACEEITDKIIREWNIKPV